MALLKNIIGWLKGSDKSGGNSQKPTLESYKKAFESAGLDACFDKLKPVARRCVVLNSSSSTDNKIALGSSKMEGGPDLPKHVQWPTDASGASQLFICQINFKEMGDANAEGLLPRNGLLSFFITTNCEFSGLTPSEKHQFKVLYTENLADLERKKLPHDLPLQSTPATLTFTADYSFPHVFSLVFDSLQLGLDEDGESAYCDLMPVYDRMLGYADLLQCDMEDDCQLVTNGIDLLTPNFNRKDPKIESMLKKKDEWLLLLETSYEELTASTTCDGNIYFWIRKQDLVNKNFDKVWCMTQFT